MNTQEETSSSRQGFFNAPPYYLWILNHQGEILDADASLSETLGYSRDELIGKPLLSLYPDAHQKDIQEQIQCLRHRNFVLYESPVITLTGTLIPVETIMFKGFWKTEPAIFGYCTHTAGQNAEYESPSFFFSCHSFEPDQGKYISMAVLAIKELDATCKELVASKEKIIQLTDEYTEKINREIQERKYVEKDNSKKNILLAEKNITLKQLLDQRDKEKQEIRDEIYKKVQSLILPLISRIQANGTDVDKRYLQAVLHNLQEIISPLSSETQKKMFILSSRELEVCNLILQGCNSKDIAEMLCLSTQTVNTHRKNIRKKLGLTTTGVNLAAYIKSDASL